MSDARLKELGELVLKRKNDISEEVKVGLLVTQLARERRKSREAQEALEEMEIANRELLSKSTELSSKLSRENCLPPAMNTKQRNLLRRYLEIQRSSHSPVVAKPADVKCPVKAEDDQVVFESIEWSARLNRAPSPITDDVSNLLDLIRFQEERN